MNVSWPRALTISALPVPDGWQAIPLRLIVGYGFFAHGYAKLARGPDHFAGILHAMGLPHAELLSWATVIVEVIGGLMIAFGALARYYAKMRAGINQFKRAKPRPDGKSLLDSRKRELYKRYTKHAGRGERNFVTYARHVAAISKSKQVERQIRRHMQKFKAWSQLVHPEDEKS